MMLQQMENQKINQKSHIPSILCSTSRNFYTRRVPPRNNSTLQQQKMVKIMNATIISQKQHRKMRTEVSEECYKIEDEHDHMRKIARVKLQNTIKRYGREWRQLLDSFDHYSKSTSREVLRMNEINFMLKMNEILANRDTRTSRNDERELKTLRSMGRGKHSDNIMEHVKLAKQNEILREKIAGFEDLFLQYQNGQGIISPQKVMEAVQQKQEERDLPFTSQGYHSLQSEVEVLRQTNDILRQEKKSLYQKINQLKTNNQNLCEEIVKCRFFSSQSKQKVEMWKNIMAMQNEEIISLKRDIGDLRKELILLNRKYQTVIKRVKAISSPDRNKLTQITRKNIELFSQQIEFFQKVKNFGWTRPFYHPSGTKQDPSPSNQYYKKYLGDKDAVNNSSGVRKTPKEYFRYYKPTFYVFVEQYFEHQGIDKENVGDIELALGIRFLATLRTILDSKYNEYLMAKKNVNRFSCLPVFVISWLSNFKIDQKTRKCQQISSDLNLEVIGTFYVKLMNPYLNSNWEVIAFRQFLLETSTIDELIFYLTARFKLMRGDSMANNGSYMQTYYVNYLEALLIIQEIVSDFNYRKKLEEYLKRNCEQHRKNQMIDGHYILRLLLEYYQYKKGEAFGQLTKAFAKYAKEFNNHMTFEVYLKIYDYNSFQLTLEQRIQIYQKAFSLGKGIVCIENVFAVINEEGYLCRTVDKMFERYVVVRQNGSHQSVTRMKELTHIDEILSAFFEKTINGQIASIGLEAHKREAIQLLKQKTLTFDVVFGKLQNMLELSIFTLRKLFFVKKLRQDEVMAIIPKFFIFVKDIVKSTIQRKNDILFVDDFLKKNAARHILNFYRRKKRLKNSLVSNFQQSQNQMKAEEVRLEFVNLVRNLKQKFNSSQKSVSQNSQSDQNEA